MFISDDRSCQITYDSCRFYSSLTVTTVTLFVTAVKFSNQNIERELQYTY